MKKTAYALLTAAIILISFFLYSSRFYPLLNSDDALNILMTYYYKLPRDFYCWGQDRGGTLIPLLARLFYRGAGLSPVLAVSFANYLLLVAGYLGFSSLMKKNSTKLLLAVAWFLPPLPFIDMLRFPLGVEYSLLGLMVLLAGRIRRTDPRTPAFHLLMATLVATGTAALWVSDTTIITLTLLAGMLFLTRRRGPASRRRDRWVTAWIAAGILTAALFLRYARSYVSHTTEEYLQINDLSTFVESLRLIAGRVAATFTFRGSDPVLSLFAWLTLLFLLLLTASLLRHKSRIPPALRPWLLFFLLDMTGMSGVILLSRWVFLNGLGPWYFVPLYIDGLLITLLLFDQLPLTGKRMQALRTFAAVTLLTGAFSTVYHLKYVSPGTLRPEIILRREFLREAPVGIIAEYWNAYITMAADPEKIKATPYEGDKNRNPEITKEVFAMPRILVIGDMWLDTFPDTLRQYGHTLVRKGKPFRMGGCRVQEYGRMNDER